MSDKPYEEFLESIMMISIMITHAIFTMPLYRVRAPASSRMIYQKYSASTPPVLPVLLSYQKFSGFNPGHDPAVVKTICTYVISYVLYSIK
ncbi:hypothetical protein T07_11256 [Trichinella nelsoni]|uniref:Uncharacterized protein n=1 Tax=Trichinella nelsoni TaxID=6336 RepID=A0A0V0RSF1_9BILA|nr:hypothetical protein T07_11256 [Trichinella nelsoni]